jgi:hypothetical protein
MSEAKDSVAFFTAVAMNTSHTQQMRGTMLLQYRSTIHRSTGSGMLLDPIGFIVSMESCVPHNQQEDNTEARSTLPADMAGCSAIDIGTKGK